MALSDLPNKPNILLLITDQQNWNPLKDQDNLTPVWDPEWAADNFPAMTRLLKHGLAFNRAHCNSCTCSPSRTTLFTGVYPAHHKVTQVLEYDDPNLVQQTAQTMMSGNFQTMSKMLKSVGYNVAYKGKAHINKPVNFDENMSNGSANDDRTPTEQKNYVAGQLYWSADDVDHMSGQYDFDNWNYPDAGDDAATYNFGGGDYNNDRRFVDGHGLSARLENSIPLEERIEASAVSYLKNYTKNHGDDPFFMVVSLVNPHDVLSYPGTGKALADGVPRYLAAGYKDSEFEDIPVRLPLTLNDSLDTKPTVQAEWRKLCQAVGAIVKPEEARKYLQFYSYLCSLVDHELLKVLDELDRQGLTEDTLIVRISDHGDMSMAHGRQRQKMFNVYRQSLNVPMIFSNPIAFPEGETTNALSGLIDLMPTIAKVAGVDPTKWMMQGRDLTPILENSGTEVQDYIHFTYDDDYLTTPNPKDMGPSHIRCIIEKDWKYAVYFDPNYGNEPEYEMYDLRRDPIERNNLAHPSLATADSEKERERLHRRLTEIMGPHALGTMPDGIAWPEFSSLCELEWILIRDVYQT